MDLARNHYYIHITPVIFTRYVYFLSETYAVPTCEIKLF